MCPTTRAWRSCATIAALRAIGMYGAYNDRSVLRISVGNWSTTENDVERSLDAVHKVVIGL
jgi:hypothetical protein